MMELAKTYEPKEVEDKLYKRWMENGYFHAKIDPNKTPYTIVIPPPNITGQLHMGHALDNTLQDILIRMKRMQGYSALWLPGTDHASIATEARIVEKLKEEGVTKEDLGREKFLERAWEWKKQYGGRIVSQLKKLGSSCDWERERFTMDEGLSKAVTEVFVRLYEKGLIYRGERIINWCPICGTSISDAEVEYEEQKGNLWHIKYPVKGQEGRFITVATTRPETMLGDTAVAVHPEDDRYKDLVGKTVILPLMNREIPVIADEYVDPSFGTGAVKITPAHDPNDFEVGLRHGLDLVKVMNDDATMNKNAGAYAGMDRYEARKAVVKDLEKEGLLVKIEEHTHNVGACYRCSTVIEPMVSMQWFVKMEPLAKPAIEVVKNGTVKFVPERFSKIYYNWMENIRDWCISRQLWRGHQIPAYYCECGEIIVARTAPEKCPKCQSTNLVQDQDTLDTWFSSALWPFSTLGWPDETEDLKYFYPTDVLVTGYDIIFFWVARMIFSALEHTGKEPFKHVVIHGLVRDALGRKMSKSLGNGIDPLEVIENYGTDALRFALIIGVSPGNDLRFSDDKILAGRNFANKIWNASRFVLMNFDEDIDFSDIDESLFGIPEKWILSRVNDLVREVTVNLDKYEFGIALQKIYEFVWEEFCDWYIELVKPRLYDREAPGRKESLYVLNKVLSVSMQLLHPFMPFVTEEIYTHLVNDDPSVMISKWPEYSERYTYEQEEKQMDEIMTAIKAIRNIRADMNVPPTRKAKAILAVSDKGLADIYESGKVYFEKLAYCSEVVITESKEGIDKNFVSAVVKGCEIYIPLGDLIDIEKEIQRLQGEKERLEGEIERVNQKLANESFVKKAPEKVVNAEKEKKAKYEMMYESVLERIRALTQ
ncbi:MAG: valine--tRNA ligase [Clostridiaceae bacterium]|nr:valine--tRNA ligase [Clostridiaceae bacterium]